FTHLDLIGKRLPFLPTLEARRDVARFRPDDDVIVLAQPAAFAKIALTRLLFAEQTVDAASLQLDDVSIGVVEAVAQHDIPRPQRVPHLAKQALFSGVFAATWADGTLQGGAHSQRQQDHI